MSNETSGGEQPGWQGQQPYPSGGYGQHGDQPPYLGGQHGDQPPYPGVQHGDQPGPGYPTASYPPPNAPGGYGQAPQAWPPQGPGQPGGQRGPGWPGQVQQHAPAGLGPGGMSPQGEAQSFSGALFDFGFNTFATPVVIKVLYILSLVGIGLFYVFAVISAFSQGVLTGLLTLVVGGVVALLSLIYTRVLLELLYAVVRIAEDVRLMRNRP